MTYALAADIGTTTLSFELFCIESGEICAQYTCFNSQRIYGTDIMMRVSFAQKGHAAVLRRSLQGDILRAIDVLCKSAGLALCEISCIVYAAHTVLLHLMRNVSCHGFAQFPFTPISLDICYTTLGDILHEKKDALVVDAADIPCIILPPLGAFIGSDICAGIIATQMFHSPHTSLLIDIGTNAEMILFHEGVFYCASAAAGPAFEGSAIPYGSDVVDIIWKLRNTGIMDATGLLEEPYFTTGFPVFLSSAGFVCSNNFDAIRTVHFTQKDIRSVQLAIAALRSGIDVLCRHAHINENDIMQVYLAGNFGSHLVLDHTFDIGLLPPSFKGKVIVSGNSSLAGAKRYAREMHMHMHILDEITQIKSCAREIVLANDVAFNELFVTYMNFTEQ